MVWHWEEELPKRLALKASEFRLGEERGTPLLEGAHSVHQDQGQSAVSVESEPDLPAGVGGCPVEAWVGKGSPQGRGQCPPWCKSF